jgi:type IX secretion system PorP/SprF family membrane protein
MKKINYLPALLILSFSGMVLHAQDIHFSQVLETPLNVSPANTGFYNGYTRAIINYRNQWAAMGNAFQTLGVSIDGGLFKSKKRPAFMGVGLTVYNDRAGVAAVRKTSVLVNVSGLVKIGKKSAFSVGLAGGAVGANGDYQKLTYASQFNGNFIDPNLSTNENPYRQFTTVDVGTGMAYEFTSFKKDPDHDDITTFKIAFGAYHLNKPVQDYSSGAAYRLPTRLVYSFTSVFDLEDTKFTLTPTAVFQTQAKYQELLFGSFIKYRMNSGTKVTGEKTQNAAGFGIFYRRKDALIWKMAFDLGDVSFGISVDQNVSGYRAATGGFGGFEISIRYNDLASSLFDSRKEYK